MTSKGTMSVKCHRRGEAMKAVLRGSTMGLTIGVRRTMDLELKQGEEELVKVQ